MGLKRQERRKLSNLEKAAIHLVFNAYQNLGIGHGTIFDRLRISHLPVSGPLDRGLYGNNHIKIGIETHGCADELDYYSSLSNTDILKPGNMDYLNTFIHEVTHHWQTFHETYTYGVPFGVDQLYGFSRQELDEMKFLKKHNKYIKDSDREKFPEKRDMLLREQHASAVATWFIIKWQLEYTLDTVDRIDLTTSYHNRPVRHSVGTVDRYYEIMRKDHDTDGRWVSRQEAKRLASHFEGVRRELRAFRVLL